jgi:hypothetical protein
LSGQQKNKAKRRRRPRPPITVTEETPEGTGGAGISGGAGITEDVDGTEDVERTLIAAVPGSVLQAVNLAREYAEQTPCDTLLIRRGNKVLHRIDAPRIQADPANALS